jgi:hypothetical protein
MCLRSGSRSAESVCWTWGVEADPAAVQAGVQGQLQAELYHPERMPRVHGPRRVSSRNDKLCPERVDRRQC